MLRKIPNIFIYAAEREKILCVRILLGCIYLFIYNIIFLCLSSSAEISVEASYIHTYNRYIVSYLIYANILSRKCINSCGRHRFDCRGNAIQYPSFSTVYFFATPIFFFALVHFTFLHSFALHPVIHHADFFSALYSAVQQPADERRKKSPRII